MYIYHFSFLVCAFLFGTLLAESLPKEIGEQLVESVENLKAIANTCLEENPSERGDVFGKSFQQCVKVKVFEGVDGVLDAPSIPLGVGVELVKAVNETPTSYIGGVDVGASASKLASTTWPSLVSDRAAKLFQTHVVRVNFGKTQDLSRDGARRASKHHFKLLFPLMVVIFMKMATFLVPLGFQFMAMIGGKALLLSKMALLLASVQGLKSVANSGFSYGVYQQPHHTGTPHTDHHYSSGYGKSSL